MRRIKVLMLGNSPSVKGGITSVITQLLNHDWNKDGIEINFIPTYIESNTIKKLIYFLRAYRKIKLEFKENRPDVVHMHMSYKGSFARKFLIHRLCQRYKVPDIIHLHGSEFEKWFNETNGKKREKIKCLLREVNSFIVLGNRWNEVIKRIEPQTNTIVISNTVHIPDDSTFWKEHFVVLFLGVLIERKGVYDLLHAVKKLDDLGLTKNVQFIIAGSGIEEENLKNQCIELGLENIVEFAGWITGKKKTELLKTSQLLVLPSYNEGLPIAVLEAMSYGLPIVATDVGDMSAAVREGENGFLVEPGDIEGMAKAMGKLILNKELYSVMSNKSREIAIKDFSDEKYFEDIKNQYFDLQK